MGLAHSKLSRKKQIVEKREVTVQTDLTIESFANEDGESILCTPDNRILRLADPRSATAGIARTPIYVYRALESGDTPVKRVALSKNTVTSTITLPEVDELQVISRKSPDRRYLETDIDEVIISSGQEEKTVDGSSNATAISGGDIWISSSTATVEQSAHITSSSDNVLSILSSSHVLEIGNIPDPVEVNHHCEASSVQCNGGTSANSSSFDEGVFAQDDGSVSDCGDVSVSVVHSSSEVIVNQISCSLKVVEENVSAVAPINASLDVLSQSSHESQNDPLSCPDGKTSVECCDDLEDVSISSVQSISETDVGKSNNCKDAFFEEIDLYTCSNIERDVRNESSIMDSSYDNQVTDDSRGCSSEEDGRNETNMNDCDRTASTVLISSLRVLGIKEPGEATLTIPDSNASAYSFLYHQSFEEEIKDSERQHEDSLLRRLPSHITDDDYDDEAYVDDETRAVAKQLLALSQGRPFVSGRSETCESPIAPPVYRDSAGGESESLEFPYGDDLKPNFVKQLVYTPSSSTKAPLSSSNFENLNGSGGYKRLLRQPLVSVNDNINGNGKSQTGYHNYQMMSPDPALLTPPAAHRLTPGGLTASSVKSNWHCGITDAENTPPGVFSLGTSKETGISGLNKLTASQKRPHTALWTDNDASVII